MMLRKKANWLKIVGPQQTPSRVQNISSVFLKTFTVFKTVTVFKAHLGWAPKYFTINLRFWFRKFLLPFFFFIWPFQGRFHSNWMFAQWVLHIFFYFFFVLHILLVVLHILLNSQKRYTVPIVWRIFRSLAQRLKEVAQLLSTESFLCHTSDLREGDILKLTK